MYNANKKQNTKRQADAKSQQTSVRTRNFEENINVPVQSTKLTTPEKRSGLMREPPLGIPGSAATVVDQEKGFTVHSPNKGEKGSFKRKFTTPLGAPAQLTDEEHVKLLREKDKFLDKRNNKRRDFKNRLKFELSPQFGEAPFAIEGPHAQINPVSLLVDDLEPQVGMGTAFSAVFGSSGAPMEIGLDPVTKELVKDLTDSLASIGDKTSQAFKQGTSITVGPSQDLLSKVSNAGVAMDLMVLAVVISTLMVWKPKSGTEKAAMVLIVVSYVGARGHLTSILTNSGFMEWASTPVAAPTLNVEPQFGSGISDMATVITGILSSYMVCSSGKTIFKPVELARVMSICGRMKMGVKSITDSIAIVVAYVHSSIDAWYTGNPYFLQSGTGFIDEYLLEAKKTIKLYEERKLYNLQSSLDKVSAIYAAGESVAIKIPGGPDTVGHRTLVNNVQSELMKIKKALVASNFRFSGTRQEPVAIMFRGPPGAGKSQAMIHLARAINAATLDEEQLALYEESPGTFTFPRYVENVYWDGIGTQTNVVIYDDMLQATEVAGSAATESMEAIRTINIHENQLHIAALEGKGNTTFQAKFVISNTNKRNFDFEAISEAGAFMRRWDIVVDVIPKSEFCKDPNDTPWRRTFDMKKLPLYSDGTVGPRTPWFKEEFRDLIGTTIIHPDMCDYHVQTYVPHSKHFVDTGKIISFDELCVKTIGLYVTKTKWDRVLKQGLADTLRRYKPASEPETPEELYDDNELFMHDLEEEPESKGSLVDFEFNPQMGNSTSIPDPKRLTYSLSERWDQELALVKINHPFNYIFIDCAIQRLAERALIEGSGITPDHAAESVFHQIRTVMQLDPVTVTLGTMDHDEFVDLVIENNDMVVKKACSGLGSKKLQVLYDKMDKMLSTIKSATAPTWVTRVGDVYRYTMFYITNFGKKVLASFGVFTDSYVFQNSGSVIIKSILMGMAGVASFAGIVAGIFALVKVLKNQILGSEPESDNRAGRLRRMRVVRPNALKPTNLPETAPQAFKDVKSNLYDTMKAIQRHNAFEVFFPHTESEIKAGKLSHKRVGYGLGIKGRAFLMPYHFMSALFTDLFHEKIKGGARVHFMVAGSGGKSVGFTLTAKEVVDAFSAVHGADGDQNKHLIEQDYCMLNLPKRVNPFKDITGLVSTEKQIEMYTKIKACMLVPSLKDPEIFIWPASRADDLQISNKDSKDWEPYVIRSVYHYSQSHLVAGDCGSPLFVEDSSVGSPLIGLHVAGSTSARFGVSSVLTREMLNKTLDGLNIVEPLIRKNFSLEVPALEVNVPENQVDIEPQAPPAGHFSQWGNNLDRERVFRKMNFDNIIPFGKITPQSAAPRSSTKSKIAKSPLYGLISPVVRAPARLAPFSTSTGDYLVPMQIALLRYCPGDLLIDHDYLEVASESVLDHLENRATINVPREKLSYRVAVEGDKSGTFDSLSRSKSAGYPYNVMPGGSTKARFFGNGPEFDFDNPEALALHEEVLFVEGLAQKGVRCEHFYTDHLKDERRSFAKVEKGETRLISAAPTVLLILFRMYFGAFTKWLIENKIYNGIALGINEYSSDWDVAGRLLERFGLTKNVGAGDYKGFDMAHKNAVAWCILQIINDWYASGDGGGDDIVREVLWLEIVNSYHINEGYLYEWRSPLPSGAPPTPTFNCLANMIYFRVCAYKILGITFNFNKHVELLVLGDDHVFATNPLYIELFNENSVKAEMAKFGQTYTPEDKNLVEFGLPRALTEVGFLKRRWYKHPKSGKYEAPLEIDTIIDMMNWVKRGPNTAGDTESNVNTAFEELSLHPREVFDYWKRKILDGIRKAESISTPPCTDYDVLFARIQERETGSRGKITCFPDYDEIEYKNPGPQINRGRFETDEGGLFSLTSRTPCVEPQSPGNQGGSQRVIRLVNFNRIATTLQESTGLTDQAAFETQRLGTQAHQNSDTTGETADAESPITQVAKYTPLSRDVLDQARTGVSQDVRDFLRKPLIINSGIFNTTDAYATFNYQFAIPHPLLYNYEVWKQKVQGNWGFRGTLVLTLTVNATRFQQGRYIMGWVPSGGGINNLQNFRMHAATLTQATQVPHVEIDLACDTEATLVIPYVTSQGWAVLDFPGGSTYGNNGCVYIAAYSPLQVSTGSPNCGWTLLGHWEDVELSMPINPQSDVRAGARVKRRVKPSELEQDSQDLGPISGALTKVSTTASIVAGIPLLSSIASPVSWASAILARAASVWGWSRPHNASATVSMARYIVNRFTNSDVADSSTKLGAFDSNEIEDLPGFAGTDLDEMSLNYVASVSAFYRAVVWPTSAAASDSLITINMNPKEFVNNTTVNGNLLTHLSPLAFVTSFFALYRGSIKLTVKIVKTEFHCGRLMVTFWPVDLNVNAAHPAPVYTQSVYCHREIIDIRYGNEFSFIIPYTSLTPYRSTSGVDKSYGNLNITVLNELVAPSSVSSNVTLLIEASAGPDMEWAEPCDFTGNIAQTYVPQMGKNECSIVEGVLGHASIQTDVQASRLCIGERIMSFRTLLRRFVQLVPTSAPTLALYNNIRPHFLPIEYYEGAVSSTPAYNNDYLTLISCCYAMARGSIRVKYVNTDANATSLPYAASFPISGDTYNAAVNSTFTWKATPDDVLTYPYKSLRPAGVFRPDSNGGVEVEFPYYNRTHSHAICDTMQTSAVLNGINPSWKGPVPRYGGYVYYTTAPSVAPLIYRATGDDHSLGLFISVPPVRGYLADVLT